MCLNYIYIFFFSRYIIQVAYLIIKTNICLTIGVLNFFLSFSHWNIYIQAWTLSTAYKIWYGVISVRQRFPLHTVTFVNYIYVKPPYVWKKISLIYKKNTDWYHLKSRDLLLFTLSVLTIPQNNVKFSVNYVTFLSVYIAPLVNI